jgi:hypothetical protein
MTDPARVAAPAGYLHYFLQIIHILLNYMDM